MLWNDMKEVPSSLKCYMSNGLANSDGDRRCIPYTVHEPIIKGPIKCKG